MALVFAIAADQDDLDARWINGVPGDPVRLVTVALVLVLSLPWIAAELGFHFPADVFRVEDLYAEEAGSAFAAAHLGHHHGGYGWLVIVVLAALATLVMLGEGDGSTVVLGYA